MEAKIVFETERMTLHHITEDDLEDFCEMLSCPITTRFWPKSYDREESREWIYNFMLEYKTHNFGRWACRLKTTGEFVGYCGLKLQPNIDGKDELEVGYMFKPRFWNKGLATEAAKASMNYAREHLGKSRIISLIRPENLPSRRVAEKNGLLPEKEVIHKGFVHIVYVSNI